MLKAAVTDGTICGEVTQAQVSIGAVLFDLPAKDAAGESVQDTGCQFDTASNIADAEIAQNL